MKRTALCLAVAALSTSPSVFADTDQATLNELRNQIAALTERLNQMEEKTEQTATAVAARSTTASWADTIEWHGDFRYRYETIDNDRTDEDRNRNRVRARIGLTAQVNEDVKVGVALASGKDDPVSSNQTLGGGGTSKGINLDMAYIDWSFAENLKLVAGKTKNPFYKVGKNGLIWDGDYRPEGAHVTYDNGTIWATAAYHFLESDNKGGGDKGQDAEEMYGAQIGYKGKIADNIGIKVGASYFHIPVEGSTPIFDFDSGDTDHFGNTVVGDAYLYDYETMELFAELNTKIAGIKTTLFADYVKNGESDADEDTGFSTGFKLGKAKNKGDWQFGYTYQDLEADAVFAAFADSDFGGGGTDVKGHKFNAAYAFSKNTTLNLTYFDNEYGDHTRDDELDFDRLQVDVKTKF